jgi:hypothetical protein
MGVCIMQAVRLSTLQRGAAPRGAKAAPLRIERPIRLEPAIKPKVAEALGLTIPRSLLLRADEVIQ